MAKGPILIDLEETPAVEDAPPVPEPASEALPAPRAMQAAGQIVARKPSRLARLFWGVTGALFSAFLASAAWNVVTGWIETQPLVGWVLMGLLGAFVLLLLLIALREVAVLSRLGRIDALRHKAEAAREAEDLTAARGAMGDMLRFYKGREDMRWGRERYERLAGDQLDASDLLNLAEQELLPTLDAQATEAVETAARQVATVTALVPLAFADVAAALTANLRMIRRIAEIYGGRAGTLGAWRLTRAVFGHLVATGAVAVGDDLLEPFLGGSLLGKLSRRFGEGLVNGALTARVGIAAMEVCRPLPFTVTEPPRAGKLVRQALAGFIPSNSASKS